MVLRTIECGVVDRRSLWFVNAQLDRVELQRLGTLHCTGRVIRSQLMALSNLRGDWAF